MGSEPFADVVANPVGLYMAPPCLMTLIVEVLLATLSFLHVISPDDSFVPSGYCFVCLCYTGHTVVSAPSKLIIFVINMGLRPKKQRLCLLEGILPCSECMPCPAWAVQCLS